MINKKLNIAETDQLKPTRAIIFHNSFKLNIKASMTQMQLWQYIYNMNITYLCLKSTSDSNVSAKYMFPDTVGFLYHG